MKLAVITLFLCVTQCLAFLPQSIMPNKLALSPKQKAEIASHAVIVQPPVVTVPSPMLHIGLTGPGSEWVTLPFATNYNFMVQDSSNLTTWSTVQTALASDYSFVAPGPFVRAYFTHK